MSAPDLNQLKACFGGKIAMTSFVSTTKNLDVADIFAGNGEYRPEIESVVFEIIIDESEQEFERSPFADISASGSDPVEEEALLCAGTVLQVKSVETKGPVTWVRVCMCQREENEIPRQLFTGWERAISGDSFSTEILSLCQLYGVLSVMRDFHQMKQILKVMQSSVNSLMDPLVAFWFECLPLCIECLELDIADADYDRRYQMIIGKLRKLTRSVLDSQSGDDCQRDTYVLPIALMDENLHLSKFRMEFFGRMTAAITMNIQPLWNLIQKRQVAASAGTERLTEQSQVIKMPLILETCRGKTFSEKDPESIERCWPLVDDAHKSSDDDQAMKLLREGLSMRSTKAGHVQQYTRLKKTCLEQEDWLAVIKCCQDIINMPQIPPNSPHITKAFMDCGFLCRELNDYSEALLNYNVSITHLDILALQIFTLKWELFSLTSVMLTLLSDIFRAPSHPHFPVSTSKAHDWIARTYKRMKQYDDARSHLLKCLDLRQRSLSSETVGLVKTFLLLIEIEHVTGNQQERDLYLQHAERLAKSSEEARDLLHKEAQRISESPVPTTNLLARVRGFLQPNTSILRSLWSTSRRSAHVFKRVMRIYRYWFGNLLGVSTLHYFKDHVLQTSVFDTSDRSFASIRSMIVSFA